MFSKVIAAALLLSSNIALAYPALGDKVTWKGSEDKLDGTSTPVSATKEVTAWDMDAHKWTVKFDMTKGDQTTTEQIVTSCLWNPEEWQLLMAKCAEKGGTMEDVAVTTGTYSACRMTVTADDGRVIKTWMGDVPFGLIKKEVTDVTAGTKTTLAIESITEGPAPTQGQ
ncbi:hypothetical protein B9G69_003930 [Bdellovibrio sp. SKB1291214]|uniref:hypothetical protein n=1 Tax=Bdellovibrio sp. SKB1291214 TaxID=1732569 RepID=UPI000B51C48C|nr:hypothetical protein [Bdellovibrio sp. SKB1291214]UYL09723.1 hypothetical protein B9G69_003930 [Bdellovibrio sp. SKB1291214]